MKKNTVISKEKRVSRGGTSRSARSDKALQPEFIQVDERDAADLLITTRDFSDHLVYFNNDNEAEGTWLNFLEDNPAYLIANLTKIDLDQYLQYFNTQLIGKAKDKESLKWVFDFMLSLALAIERQHVELPSDNALQQEIRNIIFSKLGKELEKNIAIYKAVVDENLIDKNSMVLKTDFPFDVALSQDVLATGFSKPWYLHSGASSWSDFLTGIPSNPDLFLFATTDAQKYDAAADSLQNVFERAFRSYAAIAAQAVEYLEEALHSDGSHQPHVALFITFLKLFKHAQEQINQFTKKHLDFYYQDVLKLDKKPEIPAKAHVVFELAKNLESHLVEPGTALKAGKDAKGTEVIFEMEEDIVVNNAKIGAMKSLFAPQDPGAVVPRIKHLFGADATNSLDGIGEVPVEAGQHWEPFGNEQMPLAEIGFGIASPALNLAEGDRTINFTLHLDNAVSWLWLALQPDDLKLTLTGEKDWMEFPVAPIQGRSTIANYAQRTISFSCHLTPDDDAVMAFNAQTHKASFNTNHPVARVVLRNEAAKDYKYSNLANLQLQKVEIDTEVKGIENLRVETSAGNIDATKPFLPLSATPSKGDFFSVGVEELVDKKLQQVEVKIEWKEIPEHGLVHRDLIYFRQFCDLYDAIADNFNFKKSIYKVDIDYWQKGTWQQWSDASGAYLFNGPDFIGMDIINGIDEDPTSGGKGKSKTTKELTTNAQKSNFQELLDYSQFYNANTEEEAVGHRLFRFNASDVGVTEFKGDEVLFRFTLLGGASFGHREYPTLLAKAAIDQNAGDLPEPPVTPEVADISLNYKAVDTIELASSDPSDYESNESKYYHLHPFGVAEAHAHLNNDGSKPLLLPDCQKEGSLFIGITALAPPQNVNVLFQLAEGSENPLKENPKVTWSYLSNNQWIEFEKLEISDATDGLIKSGTIRFSFPKAATTENTLLPSNMHWIRAQVEQDSDGICRFVDVLTQAGLAVWVDNANDPAVLEQALPAGTITGLKEKQSQIKSVNQPYSSFGGRAEEADRAYYTRVSERLRHKERAVTIWDYEHLVLEHFPSIYKVKCLPNTMIATDAYSEKSPGHVGLVTIPNLVNSNATDPLNPYTPKSVRSAIQTLLDGLHSGAASLKVDNPLFEQVQVEALVTFRAGYDETYFTKQLKEDIIRFLAPWAFAESEEIEFGGKIYKSVLIDYVEELEYVDFLTCFKLNHFVEKKLYQSDQDEIEATTGRSVLVSHDNHKVNDADIICDP